VLVSGDIGTCVTDIEGRIDSGETETDRLGWVKSEAFTLLRRNSPDPPGISELAE